jgi:hypothetical protein
MQAGFSFRMATRGGSCKRFFPLRAAALGNQGLAG